MWPFRKKLGQRRLEVRRSIPRERAPLWQRFRQTGGLTGLCLSLALLVGAAAMDLWPVDPMLYRVGQYVPTDIHARAKFRFLVDERVEDEKQRAAEIAPARFRLDAARVDLIAGELRKLPDRLKAATRPVNVDKGLRSKLGLTEADAHKVLAAWRNYTTAEGRARLDAQIDLLQEALPETYVVDSRELTAQLNRLGVESAVLLVGSDQMPVRLAELFTTDNQQLIDQAARDLAQAFDATVRPSAYRYLSQLLRGRHIYALDKAATQEARQHAAERIAADPPEQCYDVFRVGNPLVHADVAPTTSEQMGLTERHLELLRREQQAHLAAQGLDRPMAMARRMAVRVVVVAALTSLIWLYIGAYKRRVLTNPWRALAVVCLILLMLAAVKALTWPWGRNLYICVFPVLAATVFLTIAYDQRFALAMGVAMAALVVLQLRAGFDLFVVLTTAVAASVFQLDEIRSRDKLIRVLGISALVVFAVTACLGLFAAVPLRFVLLDSAWAGGATLAVGLLVQLILPLIERALGIATSMTLLEWCDASKPLMRRLRSSAPGTHNHSLQLGTMCEAAAEAIGAGGLLARVGAYYHDIGKINKAEYFVENQAGSASKHAKLSPAMSLLIIIGHVKDGIELAREYSLPRVLHEFIATHHGTTLVQYFYHAAAEQRKSDTDRAPDEVEYRYPGPKPRSREAAVLMLADAAESSVRAMSEPTPGRIENQVHAMVSRRLMDGQLDDCELTLRDVHRIEASLIKSLCGIYHSRISYPTPPGEKPSAAERPPATEESSAPAADKAPPAGDGGQDSPPTAPRTDGDEKASQPSAVQ